MGLGMRMVIPPILPTKANYRAIQQHSLGDST
jgi:hypothetical protein